MQTENYWRPYEGAGNGHTQRQPNNTQQSPNNTQQSPNNTQQSPNNTQQQAKQTKQTKQSPASSFAFKAGYETRQLYQNNWLFRVFSWVLFCGLVSAIAYVSWLNIQPYVALVDSTINGDNWLSRLPLIGGLVVAWGGVVATVVGILMWALIQCLQVLWLLISLDKLALQGAVKQAAAAKFYAPEGDRVAQRVAKKASRIPYFFLRWGPLLSLGAYAFDLVVGTAIYPPAKSFDRFTFALTTGSWSQIDWSNFNKLLAMLFMFEALLVLAIVCWQWIKSRQAASAE